MLTGRSQAVIFSIVIHIALGIFLIKSSSFEPYIVEHKPQAIKSYLYQPPEPKVKIIEEQEPEPIEQEKVEETSEPKVELKQAPSVVEPETQEAKPTEELVENKVAPAKTNLPAIVSSEFKEDEQENAQRPINFSSLKQFKTLNQQLDDAFIEEAIIDANRPNTGSVMHGPATYVPHSKKQLTADEKKANITYQMSPNLKTIKGDDGVCFNQEDLSNVGIEGVTATTAFSCGSTKMDKAFKAHMKKLKAKLGK